MVSIRHPLDRERHGYSSGSFPSDPSNSYHHGPQVDWYMSENVFVFHLRKWHCICSSLPMLSSHHSLDTEHHLCSSDSLPPDLNIFFLHGLGVDWCMSVNVFVFHHHKSRYICSNHSRTSSHHLLDKKRYLCSSGSPSSTLHKFYHHAQRVAWCTIESAFVFHHHKSRCICSNNSRTSSHH